MKLFATATGRIRGMNDVNVLLNFLDHRRAGIRNSAFSALAGVPDLNDATISRLKEMTDDRSFMVRKTATLKLAGMLRNYVSEGFIEIITDGSKDDKLELLKIIEQRGKADDETILLTIMHGLRDRNETVRIQSLATAEASGSRHLIPYVAGCLQEKHHKVRIIAAGALFNIGGADATDYLIGLLADKHIDVAATARQYLRRIDYSIAEKAVNDGKFMALVKGMNGMEPVRKLTVQKIGEEEIREGLSLLYIGCMDRYREVRIEALKSISVFRSPSSVEYVEKLLNDRSVNVRLEAVRTLESIGDQHALIALEWGLDDRKNAVRKAAHNAIVRIKSAK